MNLSVIPRLRKALLMCLAWLLSGQLPLYADGNEGWFEVSRGAQARAVSSVVNPASRADEALLADKQSLADRVMIANGWQVVPGIRHEPLAVQNGPSSMGTDRMQAAIKTADVNTASLDPSGDKSSGSSVKTAASSAEPLILSRGEIQEFGSQVSPQQALSPAERARQRQRRRDRLPSSSVSTVNVDMFAGEVKVLGKVDVSRVAIGNGDIVRAEVLKTGELLVIGELEGSTSLRLWHSDSTQSDYNIRVSGSDPETRVRMETMVRMRVRMIEFRKSALGKLGIDWSDSAAGPGFAIAGDAVGNNLFRLPAEGLSASLPNTVKPFSTYFGVASSITSRINFLASTGDATTLAEPVLSTTNGGSASFLAGGEVPYPSIGANGQTVVQFKEYGIKLNVSPRIDALGNVRTLVETEISQLDPAVSVQGAPGLLTRRAQTQVNVRSGETIVISGLLSSESSKDVDKLPGIGNLPVIGNFFRSKNARNAVSELVIFVTPEIVEPGDPLLSQRQQDFMTRSEQRVSQAQQQIRLLD